MSFYFVSAIANNRLLSVTDTEVRFRYQDYAHGNRITGCWPTVPRA